MGIRPPTFSSIYEQHKPGFAGWGKSEHLRGAPATDGTGAPIRLYTHGTFAISRSGEQAAKERAAKWAAGSLGVRQAIDREYGAGTADKVFARIRRDQGGGGRDLGVDLRRGDLELIRKTIGEVTSPIGILLELPSVAGIGRGRREEDRASAEIVRTMADLIDRRLDQERQSGQGRPARLVLDRIRKEIESYPERGSIEVAQLKSKALSLVDLAVAQIEIEAGLRRVPATSRLPAAEAWRMVLDGDLQASRGRLGFENEQGYMAGALRGLARMLESVAKGEPMTAALFAELHDSCIDKVNARPFFDPDADGDAIVDHRRFMQKGFRDGVEVGFGLKPVRIEDGRRRGNVTPEGRAELERRIAADPGWWFPIHELGQGAGAGIERLETRPHGRDACRQRAEDILAGYRDRTAVARTETEKLRAIARCCQELDQSHVFKDGNIRTIAFLVMNKLLIEAGLGPAILDEPNCFDGFSLDQLVDEIRQGQATFRALLPPEEQPL